MFVLQVPYLLFYADRDRDDVPDGDPEVLLTGFGMEDAHSVANSLTWGPDGWLYGCQGSTVTANIRGIEFQQGVWRYHPLTQRFELFCEGGGNSWGLDFDAHGNLLYTTNFGGFAMLHGVQGGYYWKQFGKHGALHNPYAYGYFDHVPHTNLHGGHVTVGGIVYQGDSLPERVSRQVHRRRPARPRRLLARAARRAARRSRPRLAGDLLLANDTWFAPSDVTVGPDGAVYVADWHDQRTAHPDPDAEWDRTNGRIYRIKPRQAIAEPAGASWRRCPATSSSTCLADPNDWYVRKARRLLADRRDPDGDSAADERLRFDGPQRATIIWRSKPCGPCTSAAASTTSSPNSCLDHRSADIRRWTVRLAGRRRERVAPSLPRGLATLAADEPERRRAQPVGVHRQAAAAPSRPCRSSASSLRTARTRPIRICRCCCGGPSSGTRLAARESSLRDVHRARRSGSCRWCTIRFSSA